jgi:hypothetical protein
LDSALLFIVSPHRPFSFFNFKNYSAVRVLYGKINFVFSPPKKDKNRQSEKERQVALFAISVGNQEPLCSPASSSSLVVSPTAVIARPPMIIQFTLFSIGDPFRR